MDTIKIWIITNVGKDSEKLGTFYVAGGNVKRYRHCKGDWDPSKNSICSSNSILGIFPKHVIQVFKKFTCKSSWQQYLFW
jgi:hypothetical protein